MEVPERIEPFWSKFLARTGRDPETPLHDVFHFGDCKESATRLAARVLCGEKVATSALLWEYEAEGEPLPRPGDLGVVTDWQGRPLSVIETTDVRIRPFEEVDEEFAAAEGEGDRSLASWRRGHRAFFGRVCEELELEPSPRMPVVCRRFEVAYAPGRPIDPA